MNISHPKHRPRAAAKRPPSRLEAKSGAPAAASALWGPPLCSRRRPRGLGKHQQQQQQQGSGMGQDKMKEEEVERKGSDAGEIGEREWEMRDAMIDQIVRDARGVVQRPRSRGHMHMATLKLRLDATACIAEGETGCTSRV